MGQVVTEAELVEAVNADRAAGRTVAFANGCFDLLHVGHVRYLEGAAQEGDVLVVAINDDASVRALKGSGRPVLAAEARAELVAALRCVDYVTIFDESSAVNLVESLQPEVYAKGGDYEQGTGKPLPEREVVASYGGEVRIIPLVAGHSASELIRRVEREA